MTGMPPSGFMTATNPIAELAASMAAFKVDTEVRREEAAEAREGAFKGADTQEKNTAVELLKENKAIADLYAQAQKEVTDLKAQLRRTEVDKNHEITVLKDQLTEERAEKNKLRAGVDAVIKALEGNGLTVPPIEPNRRMYEHVDAYDIKVYMRHAMNKYKFEKGLYEAVEEFMN